jgi:hypothetical protein
MTAWSEPDRELLEWADAGWSEDEIRQRELSGRRWYTPVFDPPRRQLVERAARRRVRRWWRARGRSWWKIWNRGT